MALPARDVSPAFLVANQRTARHSRIVVGLRARGAEDYFATFSAGDAPGHPAYLSSVSTLPSTFDLWRLSWRIGDVTVGIVRARAPGASGIVQMPEILGEGGPDAGYPGRGEAAPRIMDLLVGFGDLADDDYLAAFTGNLVAFPVLGAGGAWQLRATDGMDLVRRIGARFVQVPDPWKPHPSLEMEPPGALVARMVSDILVSAYRDEADAIPVEAQRRLRDANQPRGGADGDIHFWPIDTRLFYHEVFREIVAKDDPKRAVESALLPIFGGFMARSEGGGYTLKELAPRDGHYNGARGPWETAPAATITDADLVGPPAVSMAVDDRVRSVRLRYGWQVWDAYADAQEVGGHGLELEEYDGRAWRTYTLEHRFEVWPDAASSIRHRQIDGRDLAIETPIIWATQADPRPVDVFGAIPDRELLGGEMVDRYGFPIPYQGLRRKWQSPRASGRFYPRDEPVIQQWDTVHHLHEAIARIYRAGFIAQARADLPLQSRTAATVVVGDIVDVESKWIPDTRRRAMGTGPQDPLRCQVVSRKFDPTKGTVDLGVMMPLRDPDVGPGVFWKLENEVAHHSDDTPNGWVDERATYAEFDPTLADRKSRATDIHIISAWYRFYYEESDPPYQKVYTLVPHDPIHEYGWHYTRFGLAFHVETLSLTRNIDYTVGFRVSLISLRTESDEGPPYRLAWSHRREFKLRTGDDGVARFETPDSIMVPGIAGAGGSPLRDEPQRAFARGNCRVGEPDEGGTLYIIDDSRDFTQLDIALNSDMVMLQGDANGVVFASTIVEIGKFGNAGRIDVEPVPGWEDFSSRRNYELREVVAREYDETVGIDRPHLHMGNGLTENNAPGGVPALNGYEIDGQRRSAIVGLKVDWETVRSVADPDLEDLNVGTSRIAVDWVELRRLRFYKDSDIVSTPPAVVLTQEEA